MCECLCGGVNILIDTQSQVPVHARLFLCVVMHNLNLWPKFHRSHFMFILIPSNAGKLYRRSKHAALPVNSMCGAQ